MVHVYPSTRVQSLVRACRYPKILGVVAGIIDASEGIIPTVLRFAELLHRRDATVGHFPEKAAE